MQGEGTQAPVSTHAPIVKVIPGRATLLKEKTEAIDNTLNAKMRDMNKGGYHMKSTDPYLADEKRKLEQGIFSGDYQIGKDINTGKPIVQSRDNVGFLGNLVNGIDEQQALDNENDYLVSVNKEDKIKHLNALREAKGEEYLPHVTYGFGSETGKAIAPLLKPITKALAFAIPAGRLAELAGLGTEAIANAKSFGNATSFIQDMAFGGYANNLKRTYNILKDQGLSDEEAMDKAENSALIGEASGVAQAGAMGGAFGNLQASAANAEVRPFIKSLEHIAKESGKQGAYAGLGSIVNDLGVVSQGGKMSTEEILKNAGTSAEDMAKLIAVSGLVPDVASRLLAHRNTSAVIQALGIVSGVVKAPNPIKAQAKGVVSQLPIEEVKKIYTEGENNGIFSEGTADKVMSDLDQHNATEIQIPEGLPMDVKESLKGIQNSINNLEEVKKTKDKIYHPRYDALIETQRKKASKILETGDVFKNETDELGNPIDSQHIQPLEKEGELNIGDNVQWTSNGQDQFNEPKKVKSISDDGNFAFVEGSDTGIPILELNKIEPTEIKTEKVITQREGGKEPLPLEGERISTETGLTETERQAKVEERKKQTQVSQDVLQRNILVQDTKEYFNKNKRERNSSEGLKKLNELRTRARAIGLEIDDSSASVVKKTGSRKTKIKYNAKAESDAIVDESGKTLYDRGKDVQDIFKELHDSNGYLDVKREDGIRMSEAQIDATVQDILDGVPSKRANNYLDALERAIKDDSFPVYDKALGENELNLSQIRDLLGVEKETIGEPMDEASFNAYLDGESKLTPEEDQQLTDNIENLLHEYESESETGVETKIQQPKAESETGIPAKAEPIEGAGKTEPSEKTLESYKDLNKIEKRKIINSKFEELVKELKIEKICP